MSDRLHGDIEECLRGHVASRVTTSSVRREHSEEAEAEERERGRAEESERITQEEKARRASRAD